MKDAYSFHADAGVAAGDLRRHGRAPTGASATAWALSIVSVEADSGQIGGKVTCEFMALAESGEAELVHCTCGYAADAEAWPTCTWRCPTLYDVRLRRRSATPGVHTIAELAAFLDIPETSTVKALVRHGADDGRLVVLFMPGDHELNELKADRA